ncbi:hypothetical protein L3Y34_006288 [Caenorhabditis briggsae]|nr:hypothetical protein L3Y34_006288 [Caenorhabditis briggsae]
METSSSSLSLHNPSNDKCRICLQSGHGFHFGVFSCRACAAFFRRCHLSSILNQRKCRSFHGVCGPNRHGRWFCKTCRLARCMDLGMTTENIQYDRDSFTSLDQFQKATDKIPHSVESSLGIHPLVAFIYSSESKTNFPFIDTTRLVQRAIINIRTPNMIKRTRRMSNLQQLAVGLEEFQSTQKENVFEKSLISRNDHRGDYETGMCAVATWLSCSDKIRNYPDELKIRLLQSIWFIWGRLERVAMTARMRSQNLCGKNQFVVSKNSLIHFDSMKSDNSHLTNHTFEEMRFFFTPKELYYDELIWDIMEVQPDDVELTFIMSMICFHVAATHFGGETQEEMERLQDVLADDLHEHYTKNYKTKYSLRLKQLMRIKENFLKLRNIRLEKYSIGGLFNLFNMNFSNPEFFWVPPQKYV